MSQQSHRRRIHRLGSRQPRRQAVRRLLAEALEERFLLTTLTSIDPPANSHDAPAATDVIATFDQNINAATATPLTLRVHAMQRGQLSGAVTTDGAVVTFDPTGNLLAGEFVQITATSAIQSTSSDPVVAQVSQFRAGVSGGSGEFVTAPQSIGAGGQRTGALGDFDGDGDLDVFLGTSAINSLWLNDGTGALTDTGQSLGNGNSQGIDLGDIDGDGDLDAFIANRGSGNEIWFNDGGGQLTSVQAVGNVNSYDVDLGDLDGDGDLDAFVANNGTANRVWLNNGSGTFSDSGLTLGSSISTGVEVGDLDGDGDLDAMVSNRYAANRIWLNDGSGGFTDSGQSLGTNSSEDVQIGDFDGDGDLDAFTGNNLSNRVWVNDGSGVFVDSGQVLGNRNTFRVSLGDVDADGDLDAIAGNGVGNANNTVYLNDGGIFTDSGQQIGNDINTYGIATGDIDNDGDLDIFSFNYNFGGSRAYQNRNLVPSVSLGLDSDTLVEAAGAATVTATLSAAHTAPVTVELQLTGTATATDDYTMSGTEIAIAAGETSGSVTITAVQDSVDEPDESVVIDIVGVTNGQEAGTQRVTATILDDDEAVPVPDVTLSVDNGSIAEAAGVATFTANLSVSTTVPVTIDLGISGTAAASDFTTSGTQIVVAPGATSGSITVTAVQDDADEPDETVVVDITSVSGGTELGTQQQTTTIADDDEPPMPDVTLSLDNSDIAEAAGVATFTVTLSETTTVPVTVDLGVSGTAAATDFTASATQVVIAAGATTGSVTVTAVQDEVNEPDETVIVDITNVTNGNEDGDQQQTTTILDDDIPPSFAVTSLTSNGSGFQLEFTSSIDAADINIYDTQNAGLGAADVVVTGATSGPVTGSVIVGDSSVTFVKTGDPLAADTYTVTLRSAADGFKDTDGMLLDGDGDGTGGDDYSDSFTVDAIADARTVSLPDFVRGPGQDVNLPADGTTGIPLSISDGDNVRAADVRIAYDPALLEITGATAPAGGSVIVNTATTPGVAILVFFSSASLPAGTSTFINLEATIPAENASANYRGQQLLDLHAVTIGDGNDNEFAVVVDDALHYSTYFSDVSGNGRVNASDAAQVARFAALIDSGFAGSLVTDPILVGDISGNGRLNAADASLVARFAALIPVAQIPPIPAGIAISGVLAPANENAAPLDVDRSARLSQGGQAEGDSADDGLGFAEYSDTLGVIDPTYADPYEELEYGNRSDVFDDLGEDELVDEELVHSLAIDSLGS